MDTNPILTPMHATSSIIPCACGIEEATDTNAQPILSQHEIRIRLRVGVSVRDRTMVRFRGFHSSRGDLNESLSAENAKIYLF